MNKVPKAQGWTRSWSGPHSQLEYGVSCNFVSGIIQGMPKEYEYVDVKLSLLLMLGKLRHKLKRS